MASSTFQLVLVPGLGADERLFEPQRRAFPDLWVPPWLPPERRETLPEYAARLAATVPGGRPLILGGVSLGGMLAWEMAPYLKPQAVVLIASFRTRSGLNPLVRRLGVGLPLLPAAAFEASKLLALLVGGRVSRAGGHRPLTVSMYCDSDARRLRWACRAVLDWHPRPDDRSVPVFHIHGDRDPIIPVGNVAADMVVNGGGHVINLTHAEEVNRFIAAAARRVVGSFDMGAS